MVILREGDPPNYAKFWSICVSPFINLKNFLGLRLNVFKIGLWDCLCNPRCC